MTGGNARGYERALKDYKTLRTGRIRRQVNNVLRLVPFAANEAIAEIGVATGKFSRIAGNNNQVFAFDIAHENLLRARQAVKELGNNRDLFCIQADCAHMPCAASVFDKVLAIDIIEHLTDAVFSLFCREAYRVLKPGGSLFIYTPNLLHPYELARPFRPVLRKEHIGVRSRARICVYLRAEGFVIRRQYFNNCFRRISIEAKK